MEVDKCSHHGRLLTVDAASVTTQDSSYKDGSPTSSTASQRSESVSSASSASSASSGDPCIQQKTFVKIPPQLADTLVSRGLDVSNSKVVAFRPGSKLHPRNWSATRKWYCAAVICFMEMYATLVSNTGSSIAVAAAPDLGLSDKSALACFTTTYLLAQAFGGLLLAPVAEAWGGRMLYILGNAGFTASSIFIFGLPNLPVIIVGRMLCGFISALPTTVAVSTFEDMFDAKDRIWVFYLWVSGAVVALGIGPVVATYVSTSSLKWPCVFGLSAAMSGLSIFLCVVMGETRPSMILEREIRKIDRELGASGLSADLTHKFPSFSEFCETSLFLPVKLYFTERIVFLTSFMAASVFGIVYLFPEAFFIVFVEDFGFDARHCSLVNLAFSAGAVFTFLPRLYDWHLARARIQENRHLQPEDKLFGFLVAAPVLAIAFWWFGLSIPPLIKGKSPWIPIVPLSLVGYSVVEFDTVLTGYLTDTYNSRAGLANASLSFMRATLSGLLPLLGHEMFEGLGSNNAMFLLAVLAMLYCGAAVLFKKRGQRNRMKSSLARQLAQQDEQQMVEMTDTPSVACTAA